jgi:hypothetical protein
VEQIPLFVPGGYNCTRSTKTVPDVLQALVGCQALGLFFYFFDGMNLPPVRADFGVVAGDSFYSDGLADWRQIARKPGNAFGHNAARAIHAFDFGIFADADIRVTVASFRDLSDEPTDGSMRGHFVGPAIGILGDQLTEG